MNDTWSLDALIARFELHPEFREVYVEGDSDIGLYQLFFDEGGREDVTVYPISAVSLRQEDLEVFALPNMGEGSKRTDLILLALVLDQTIPSSADRICCIVDADTEHIRPTEVRSNFLLFTDYTSAELYAYRADFVTKLIRIGSPNSRTKGEDVLSAITVVLEELFSFRMAGQQLGWGLRWLSPNKELLYEDGVINFNEIVFVRKYLNTRGKLGSESEFWANVIEIKGGFSKEHRNQIRGHDFIEVLAWFLKKHTYRAFHKFSEDIIRHNLLSQLRFADLTEEPLFVELLLNAGDRRDVSASL